jgi:hypothetical protein
MQLTGLHNDASQETGGPKTGNKSRGGKEREFCRLASADLRPGKNARLGHCEEFFKLPYNPKFLTDVTRL